MAVKLIANYAKKLGLPGYSSHQFSISVETELMNVEFVDETGTTRKLTRDELLVYLNVVAGAGTDAVGLGALHHGSEAALIEPDAGTW